MIYGDTTTFRLISVNKRTTIPAFESPYTTYFVTDDQARFLSYSNSPNGFAIAGNGDQ